MQYRSDTLQQADNQQDMTDLAQLNPSTSAKADVADYERPPDLLNDYVTLDKDSDTASK